MTMHVIDLNDHEAHDPRPVLAGPWRWLRLFAIAPGTSEELERGEVEYAAYVLAGDGRAVTANGSFPLGRGTSLVLLRGAGAVLEAGDGGLRVFVEAVDAPRR
jgi:hypothetical protein